MDITSIFLILIFVALGIITYLIFRSRFKKQKEQLKTANPSQKKKQSSFRWTYDKEGLEYQVENYKNLSITKSARGAAFLLICFSVGLTIIFGLFNVVPLSDAIGSAVIYLPLAFFVYKGHRWAMVSVLILWTLDKAFQISQTQSAGGIIIWWLIFMPVYYKAYQVEQARRAKTNLAYVPASNTIPQDIHYCRFCGKQINPNAKFCPNCGKQL